MKYLAAFFLFHLLTGCHSSPVELKEKTPEQISSDSSSVLRGHYVWGHEVNTFTPFGSTSTFWVKGDPSSLKELETKYKALTKTPYEKTFVAIIGKTHPKDINSDGFDSDYDGLISIDSIESMTTSSNTDCN
jgi:hypothetical protein